MHTNAAALLNRVQLSVAIASIPAGPIVTLGRAPSGPVVHGRKLNQVSVSSVAELTAAVSNSGMSSSLATAKEASLLAGSADFGSLLKESASLAEQVTATAHAAVRLPRSSAFLPFSCTPNCPRFRNSTLRP